VKLNQPGFDGELHNATGFAFAPDIVDMADEFTERQASFPAIGFHGLKHSLADRARAMGCSPHAGLPHDDFRRADDQYRRADDDSVMMFISRVFVPAPIAIRYNAAGGGKQGNNAG
jgi:hypothetical protein